MRFSIHKLYTNMPMASNSIWLGVIRSKDVSPMSACPSLSQQHPHLRLLSTSLSHSLFIHLYPLSVQFAPPISLSVSLPMSVRQSDLSSKRPFFLLFFYSVRWSLATSLSVLLSRHLLITPSFSKIQRISPSRPLRAVCPAAAWNKTSRLRGGTRKESPSLICD